MRDLPLRPGGAALDPLLSLVLRSVSARLAELLPRHCAGISGEGSEEAQATGEASAERRAETRGAALPGVSHKHRQQADSCAVVARGRRRGERGHTGSSGSDGGGAGGVQRKTRPG